jgi:hypothetical protein
VCCDAQELAGVLRRALGQQAPVREALYGGIMQVCVRASHDAMILDLLPR